ncbi:tail fiber assembly protein [Aeromonas veronii]
MATITWDEQGFAEQDGAVTAYKADPISREYLGATTVWVSMGTGLPADIYMDAPTSETKAGFAIVRASTGDKWQQVEDHRGTTVYDTITKAGSYITALGPIPDGKTDQHPTSPYDKWSGIAWVTDEDAEQQATLEASMGEQTQCIAMATQQIAVLTPAVDGGYAKPEHTQLLADWQRYRYELTLVSEQAGWPESPQWPTEPDKVI